MKKNPNKDVIQAGGYITREQKKPYSFSAIPQKKHEEDMKSTLKVSKQQG